MGKEGRWPLCEAPSRRASLGQHGATCLVSGMCSKLMVPHCCRSLSREHSVELGSTGSDTSAPEPRELVLLGTVHAVNVRLASPGHFPHEWTVVLVSETVHSVASSGPKINAARFFILSKKRGK